MAVKIRLARRGRKKLAIYDVVVADARAPRDGRFIEKLGIYNPNTTPAMIDIREDKALDWLLKGAKPTDTVRAMLSYRGVMLKKHLQIGVNKGAITQEEADKRFNDWIESKDAQVSGQKESLAKKREDERKARLEAEKKVNEARAKELAASQKVEEEPATEEAEAETAEETTAAEATTEEAQAPAQEEAPAEVKEEPKAEAEAPAAAKEEEKVEEKKEEAVAEKKEEVPEAKAEETKEEVKEEEKKEEPKAEAEAPASEKKEDEASEEKKES
ncbi:30S ribosomal protein S16 [Catalinimonas niigatensis]|uniref:30S ribosomal protein S16 n=1 Tax=Catalinimonas niigatensis TaxID=1397264 RepID=UPI002AA29E0E|nr:30S ribosomal protein S16 [Catalinimonas niigatensis]WPP53608.1 30S ribosomal protein S16 [Catalinimonas niigatensis]